MSTIRDVVDSARALLAQLNEVWPVVAARFGADLEDEELEDELRTIESQRERLREALLRFDVLGGDT
jgi:hypothetical protein